MEKTIEPEHLGRAVRDIVAIMNEASQLVPVPTSYRVCVCVCVCIYTICRNQRPRGLMGGSAAARLLGLRVRIPPGAWISVCCECCV